MTDTENMLRDLVATRRATEGEPAYSRRYNPAHVARTDAIEAGAEAIATVSALRHALWNLAGTVVALADDPDDARRTRNRALALDENSPLVDAARDAVRRFGLNNVTAPEPPR